jgi:hypothetical protein
MSAGAVNPFDRNLDAFFGPTMPSKKGSPSARRELLLVGHLPVLSAVWLSQYADREARTKGPTCLIRLEQDAVLLELFRAGAKRPTISSLATLEEALRAIAPIVGTWLIVSRSSEPVVIEPGTASVVVLTGADDMAVVAAYTLVRQCVDSLVEWSALSARPSVRVAVLGADDERSAAVRDALRGTAEKKLNFDLEVRGGLQRVAPVESAFRGTFDASSPTIAQISALITHAEMADDTAEIPPTIHGGPVMTPEPHSERFSPRTARVGPGKAPATHERSEAPIPFRAVEIEATADTAHSAPPARTAFVPAAPRAREVATPVVPPVIATVIVAAAVPSVGLTPEPAVLRSARAIDSPLPTQLTPHFSGLEPFPFRAPKVPAIEIACDSTGQLHVIASAAALASLLEVRAWIREHRAILHAAHPSFTSTQDAIVDVVYATHRDAKPIDGARVHVLTLIELGGHRGYLAQRVFE